MTETDPPPLASPGWGARIGLFVAVAVFGALVSMVLVFLFLQATGPKGPDSAMGNSLGALMLAPVGGLLFGLAALLWQARYDRTGKRSALVAAVCLILFFVTIFVFAGLGAI